MAYWLFGEEEYTGIVQIEVLVAIIAHAKVAEKLFLIFARCDPGEFAEAGKSCIINRGTPFDICAKLFIKNYAAFRLQKGRNVCRTHLL